MDNTFNITSSVINSEQWTNLSNDSKKVKFFYFTYFILNFYFVV